MQAEAERGWCSVRRRRWTGCPLTERRQDREVGFVAACGRTVLTMARFIELSHEIVPGMKTYPGLPEPKVEVLLDYEASRERYQNQAEFYIASLHLCGNTGTYVDSPRHRYRQGVDLASLPLERLADLPTIVIDASTAGRAISGDAFRTLDLSGRAILFRTDFSKHWGTPAYFTDNPF